MILPAMLSPHFSLDEMKCHHCDKCLVDKVLLNALEELRSLGPEPIIVHDACRCAEHNKAVGGVPNSQHEFNDLKDCEAADIEIKGLSLQQMYDRAETVKAFNNGGIGAYDGAPFIHVDVRKNRARWGRIKGRYVAVNELIHDPHNAKEA